MQCIRKKTNLLITKLGVVEKLKLQSRILRILVQPLLVEHSPTTAILRLHCTSLCQEI